MWPPEGTWLWRRYFDFMFGLTYAGFTFGLSYRSIGSRFMPRTGPVLVVSNHASFLDPVLVGLAVRRPVAYLARKTLFRNRLFSAVIRSLGAVALDQDGTGARVGL